MKNVSRERRRIFIGACGAIHWNFLSQRHKGRKGIQKKKEERKRKKGREESLSTSYFFSSYLLFFLFLCVLCVLCAFARGITG